MPQNLEKRGDVYYFRAVIGGKLYRRSTEFHDLKSAQRRAAEFERDIRAGIIWGEKPVPVFRTWAAKCLEIITSGKADPDRDIQCAHYGIDTWGDTRMNEIRPTDCAGYITTRLAAGAAAGTVAREVVILSRMFRLAVADDLLTKNPWAEIKRPKGHVRDRVLTLEEEGRLRATLLSPWAEWLTVALLTGLRLSEQLHLCPTDVRDGLIHVGQYAKGGKARVVPLRPEAVLALDLLKPAKAHDRYWPRVNDDGVRYAFQRAQVAAAITPELHVHDFRRTFGTRAAEGGMLPLHLMKIMGHSSVETTARYYVHLTRLSIVEAMQRAALPLAIG